MGVAIGAAFPDSVAAQDEPRVFNWKGGGWAVWSDQNECSMLRIYEDDVVLAFSFDPRERTMSAYASSDNWESLRSRHGQNVRLELTFDDARLDYDEFWSDGATVVTRGDSGASIVTGSCNREDTDRLLLAISASPRLALEVENLHIGRYRLDGSAAAVRKMFECSRALLDTERDPFTRLPQPDPPQPDTPSMRRGAEMENEARLISRVLANYPSAALRAGEQGTVTVLVTVMPNGRVGGCTVSESSGSETLDTAACQSMERYARYRPALDDAGSPVKGTATLTLRYSLPD